jgi:hypothetical protein
VNDMISKFHLSKLEVKRELAASATENREGIQQLERTLQSRLDAATVQLQQDISRLRVEDELQELDERLTAVEDSMAESWEDGGLQQPGADLSSIRAAIGRSETLRQNQEAKFLVELTALRVRVDESQNTDTELSRRLEEVEAGRTFVNLRGGTELGSNDTIGSQRQVSTRIAEDMLQELRQEVTTVVGVAVDEKLSSLHLPGTLVGRGRPPEQLGLNVDGDHVNVFTAEITERYLADLTATFTSTQADDGRIALRSDIVALGLEQARIKEAMTKLEASIVASVAVRTDVSPVLAPAVYETATRGTSTTGLQARAATKVRAKSAQEPAPESAPDTPPAVSAPPGVISEASVELIAGYAAEIDAKLTSSQVDCRLQIARASRDYEARLDANTEELRAGEAMERLGLCSWLQSIEGRLQSTGAGVSQRIVDAQNAAKGGIMAEVARVVGSIDMEQYCGPVAARFVQSALSTAEEKISTLEQEMNEVFEENEHRMAALESENVASKACVDQLTARVTVSEEVNFGFEATCSMQLLLHEKALDSLSEDASRSNIIAETGLALLERQLKRNIANLDERLDSRTHAINSELEDMKQRLETLASSAASVEDMRDEMRAQLDAVKDDIASTDSNLQHTKSHVEDGLVELRGRLHGQVDEVATMKDSVDGYLGMEQLTTALATQKDQMVVMMEKKVGYEVNALRELVTGESKNVKSLLDSAVAALKDRVGNGITAIQTSMDEDREHATKLHDDQLRSARALRRLQKLMSRPDAGEIFRSFDTNGDGTIDRLELKQGFERIGESMEDKDVDALMQFVDSDGDGNVDYEEFLQMSKISEKMAEMTHVEREERAKLTETVEQIQQNITAAMEAQSETQASGLETLKRDLRQTIEVHTQAIELVQAHVDIVQRETFESEFAFMTETLIFRAAQIRQEERTTKVLFAANTALQEVHRHTESLVALQEDVGHDRSLYETAFAAVQGNIAHIACRLNDAELHINVEVAVVQAAATRQREQVLNLQEEVANNSVLRKRLEEELLWLQEQVSGNDATVTEALELVQSNVAGLTAHLRDAETNMHVYLTVTKAGLSRCAEQILALKERANNQRSLNKSELASLARVMRASISAVQDHIDVVDDKVEQMDAYCATELFMYQYGLQRFAEDLVTDREEKNKHLATFREQLDALEQGTQLAVQAVQSHVDTIEEKVVTSEVEVSAELLILHAAMGKMAEAIGTASHEIEKAEVSSAVLTDTTPIIATGCASKAYHILAGYV